MGKSINALNEAVVGKDTNQGASVKILGTVDPDIEVSADDDILTQNGRPVQ